MSDDDYGKKKEKSYFTGLPLANYGWASVQLDGGSSLVKVTHTNAARHDVMHLTWGDRVYVWWCGSDVVLLTS